MVDARVYIFAMGMAQAFFKPRELPVLKQWRQPAEDEDWQEEIVSFLLHGDSA